jgi:hypothetical protein
LRIKGAVIRSVIAVGLLASPAWAQSSGTWNGLPDRFQIDTGYFHLTADTRLRFDAPFGASGDVDFEKDLGQDEQVDTFWVDGTWRVGRRHQLKLGFTKVSRERADYTLQRDFVWGGQTFDAGLSASSSSSADILGGYYRFAIVRNDRIEIGPSVGVGYLWLDARIQATGGVGGQSRSRDVAASASSITGAVGGYASAWLTRRLVVHGDFLYIKVTPENDEASITDWRLAADYYFSRHVGAGVQYKYNQYSQDRGFLVAKLGGDITFEGFQVFATFLF